jgi:hypothetical protein
MMCSRLTMGLAHAGAGGGGISSDITHVHQGADLIESMFLNSACGQQLHAHEIAPKRREFQLENKRLPSSL